MFYLEKKEIKKRKTMIAKTKQFNLTKKSKFRECLFIINFPIFFKSKRIKICKIILNKQRMKKIKKSIIKKGMEVISKIL